MHLTGKLTAASALSLMILGASSAVETTPRSAEAPPAASAEAHRDLNPFDRWHPHCAYGVGSVHYHRVYPFPSDKHKILSKGSGTVTTYIDYGGSLATTTFTSRCR